MEMEQHRRRSGVKYVLLHLGKDSSGLTAHESVQIRGIANPSFDIVSELLVAVFLSESPQCVLVTGC